MNGSHKRLGVEGHRGAITNFHENTLEAFLEADRLKLDGIEFDLWLTKDKVPVIAHGKSANGLEVVQSVLTNRLECLFLPQVDSTDLKNYLYPNSQSRIPTFEEMLRALKDSSMYLNVELKDYSRELIDRLLGIIKEVKPTARVTFSSFNLALRADIDELSKAHGLPRFPFGYLVDQEANLPDLAVLAAQILPQQDSLNIDIQFVLLNNLLVKEYVSKAAAVGLHVKAYNLMVLTAFENPELYDALLGYGVQTFICNRAENLIEYNKRS